MSKHSSLGYSYRQQNSGFYELCQIIKAACQSTNIMFDNHNDFIFLSRQSNYVCVKMSYFCLVCLQNIFWSQTFFVGNGHLVKWFNLETLPWMLLLSILFSVVESWTLTFTETSTLRYAYSIGVHVVGWPFPEKSLLFAIFFICG